MAAAPPKRWLAMTTPPREAHGRFHGGLVHASGEAPAEITWELGGRFRVLCANTLSRDFEPIPRSWHLDPTCTRIPIPH